MANNNNDNKLIDGGGLLHRVEYWHRIIGIPKSLRPVPIEPNATTYGYVYLERGPRTVLPPLRHNWPFALHLGGREMRRDSVPSNSIPADREWNLPSLGSLLTLPDSAQAHLPFGRALDLPRVAVMAGLEPRREQCQMGHENATRSFGEYHRSPRDSLPLVTNSSGPKDSVTQDHPIHVLNSGFPTGFGNNTQNGASSSHAPAPMTAPTPSHAGPARRSAGANDSLRNPLASQFPESTEPGYLLSPGGITFRNPFPQKRFREKGQQNLQARPTHSSGFSPRQRENPPQLQVQMIQLPSLDLHQHQISDQVSEHTSIGCPLPAYRPEELVVNNQTIVDPTRRVQDRHRQILQNNRNHVACSSKTTPDDYAKSIQHVGQEERPEDDDYNTRNIYKRRKLDDRYPRLNDDLETEKYYARIREARDNTRDSDFDLDPSVLEITLDTPCTPAGCIQDPITGDLINKMGSMIHSDEKLARKYFRKKWGRWCKYRLPQTLQPLGYESRDSDLYLSEWDNAKKEREPRKKMKGKRKSKAV